ncbi:MAGE protein [Ostreococcus tauri]|uniref:MAGE protein n=2 Tax=Ostreococcus tauri TaxID=70448 RepID=A0A090M7R9_OSTTA|nr:MAGE protein [Ostreococcus tauri]CEF98169.1 MAGE protein [Ostreococcus tauri]|eukprot:XP_003079594.2 MAGE protein [Ostreococcus tauri]
MATATARRSRARAEETADADNRARASDSGVTKRAKTTAVTATTGGMDDDGADDVDRAPASNSAYVGVRDADVGELSQRYTQRAEEASGALGNRAEHLSAEERDRLTSEVMRYVLFASHRDQGAPIQRTKISDAMSAIGGAGGRARAGSYIVALAQKKFLEIFGYEMVECSRAQSKNKKPAKTLEQANTAPAKCFALRSVLPAQMRRKFVDDPKSAPARGFTLVVAALIQISSGCIREDALFEQLKVLGINDDVRETHAELGSVDALLQSLVKRRVFLRERTSHDDPSLGYSYELAEGAEAMIGYENIDKFVNEIMRSQVAVN